MLRLAVNMRVIIGDGVEEMIVFLSCRILDYLGACRRGCEAPCRAICSDTVLGDLMLQLAT